MRQLQEANASPNKISLLFRYFRNRIQLGSLESDWNPSCQSHHRLESLKSIKKNERLRPGPQAFVQIALAVITNALIQLRQRQRLQPELPQELLRLREQQHHQRLLQGPES